jgi:L-ascorbate metabolism protein UlaG (beta-lactamase superfamily)
MHLAKITFWGHSAFKIDIAGNVVVVDPFLDHNAKSPVKARDVKRADIVFATHDHADHLGEAFSICHRTGATFVGVAELAGYARENGVKKVVGLNIGGGLKIRSVKLTLTQATHTASKGAPTGVVVEVKARKFTMLATPVFSGTCA